MKTKFLTSGILAAGVLIASVGAHASLTTFQTFTGDYGVSSAGWGSTTQSGNIEANVPLGATVVAAYLYTSTFGGFSGAGGTLDGTSLSYTALPVNSDACCSLQAGRTDVTSIVASVINGGAGGVYNFPITETSGNQDGEGLVVVYSLPSLATSTIGIVDGFAATLGDTTSINFSQPLDPSAPGFSATMALGIGFSYDSNFNNDCTGSGQTSTITVNGTTITNNAGCNDSSIDPTAANGNLITVGGFINGVNPLNMPTVAQDHEMYNLTPEITKGDTSITVNTFNTSHDDNIYLGVFDVTGVAGFNAPPATVPEPYILELLGLAMIGLGYQRKFSKV